MGSVQSSLDAQSVYDKSQLMQMLSAFISRGSGDGLKGLALQGINLSDSTTSILIAGFSILFAIVIAFLFKNRGGGARGSQTDIGSAQSRDVDMGETQQDLCDEEKRKEVTVLFGTQTGTAERFAKSIVEEGNSRYRGRKEFKAICLQEYAEEGSQYGKKLSKASLVIFTMATYGDGEPTDDANNFYNWITSDEQAEVKFPELVYAVFGLGNRQYEHFNKVGTTIYNCLKDKGAKPLLACGLGDDDKMIEDDFSQWKEELWVELDKILGASDEDSYIPVIPKYRIGVHQNDTKLQEDNSFHKTNGEAIHDGRNPFRAIVSERRELHKPESDRSCTHLEFDIAGSGLSYEAGDHVGVFAENCGEIVEAMAQCLGQPLDLLFTLYSEDEQGMPMPGGNSLPPPFPGPCTLRTALSKYADLLNSPRKESLRAMAEYAADPSEKDRLNYLCSKEGREEYGQWIFASQRSLLEVLLEFPSVKVPLQVFFAAVAPRLQPRFYSISSSPNFVGNRVHVTCALVHEPTPTGRIHQGVCSTWMKHSTPASEGSSEACSSAPIFIRQSNFKLPKDPKLPIIMIGPGTGLAPFRGFLQERAILLQSGVELGPAILYFGCRNRKFDFIYEEELNGFVESGVLSKLNVAFSREGPQKEYVQHLLAREGGEIWKLLSEGAYFYVCGDAKSMAKDVHKTLLDIIEKHKSGDGQSAESILNSIQTEGRYLKDVW